jgi:uncharacterized 2Fe-2S/4Fe-4S cluster protein (DUF4445 family)
MVESFRVTFVDPADESQADSAPCPAGGTVLDAAHAAGVAIEATCGARGRCRSCRIKVLKGDIPPATMQDTVQLGVDAVREHFRLACQTKVIAGCRVMAVPPKSEAGHQILTSGGDVAASGFHLDSGVEKHVIEAKAPTEEHHQTSDADEILAALPAGTSTDIPLEVRRKIPSRLRERRGVLTVTTFQGRLIDVEAGDTAEHAYGMAFDIGTTSIVGTLMNLRTCETLAEVGGVNPQAVYGGDLMSRIAYAQFDAKKLQTLRAKALNALNDFVKEACGKAGVSAQHLYKIVIVGNTCMHHIVLGIDVTYVGLAPYAPAVRDPIVVRAAELPLKAAPNAQACFLPIVAGFVGADTMACVLATRIYESDEIRALVDIGTNGEVVMGSKDGLMACSAPAGPALEGAQITHGMRGAVGAIERVEVGDDVVLGVIGDVPAMGICGSGLIDLCAKLARAGALEPSGRLRKKDREALPPALGARFNDTPNGIEFVLLDADASAKGEPIVLTQADIRQLQLAKSAIYSGIVLLQKVMGISDDDLAELMMCGGFGNYINIESAVRIRLLPALPLDTITYEGNAALMGAQMALLSETERERARDLAMRIEHVALAARPEFQDVFMEGMSFLADDPWRAPPEEEAAPPPVAMAER